MPRPRVSELSQGQAPKLRTSSSTSQSKHPNRLLTTERSSKFGADRKSPKSGGGGPPLGQKKLGGRISDLESQLRQAQEELRLLKEQLASAEAVKKQAQDDNNSKKQNPLSGVEVSGSEADSIDRDKIPGDVDKETDVFEVPEVDDEKLVAKEDEIKMLKARLYDMEKEHESLGKENVSLKNQLSDSASEMSKVKANEDEMASKVSQIGEELEESRAKTSEEAKEALEGEMKKLRVQTEQWRKAADAAAAVLSGDKCCVPSAVVEFVDDSTDDGSGKRRSSGMKMFGDLWKKKGHK